jgi:hypothetical protein
MRKSSYFFLFLLIGVFLLFAAFVHAALQRNARQSGLREKSELVRTLELTDLCLFTEARYTRHPSQADLHSPFQDHPVSMEHFPSGSLLLPLRRKAENHANVD